MVRLNSSERVKTLPGVVPTLIMNLNHEQQVRFLFTGAFGTVVANNAMIAGRQVDAKPKSERPAAMASQQPLKQLVERRKRVPKLLRASARNLLGLACNP